MTRVRKIGVGSQIGAGLSGYVAEIGAGLCCADLGLPNVLHDSHASYVGHWLGILRGDKSAIIHAAAKAEQAFAYLKSFGALSAEDTADGNDAAVSEPALAA
ncbi:hypothetical protein SAMN02927924_04031 [Sphingobium faniae]|nr:hypothetical protein SAMN02927924_04031 [Sphingobium faniae]